MFKTDLKQNIFVEAYHSYFNMYWGDSDYANTDKEDVCYKIALNAYLDNSEYGINQRNLLLFEYLKPVFASGESEDILNKLENKLPVSSDFINRIIINKCNLYTNEVYRDIEDDKIIDLVNETEFNEVIDRSHKVSKMTGEVAVRPIIRDNIKSFQIIEPHLYRTEYSNGKLTKFTYVVPIENEYSVEVNNKNQIIAPVSYIKHVWTDSEHYKILDGNEFERERNIYNEIPFVILRLSDFNTYSINNSTGGGYNLLNNQLRLNMIDVLQMENEVYGTIGFWLFKNIPLGDKLKVGAGRFINIQHEDVNQPEPDIIFKSAEKLFDLLSEHKNNLLKSYYKAEGLPSSVINENSNLSGKAILLDRIELNEWRRLDVHTLKRFDIELLNKAIRVYTKDGFTYNEVGNYSIKYNEQDLSIDKTEQLEYLKELMSLGLYSIVDVANQLGFTGDEGKIKELINYNKELNSGYDTGLSGNGEGEEPTAEITVD